MSDEETDNESNGFTVNKLSWKSNVLNRLQNVIDGRYDESRKNQQFVPNLESSES